jgi:hypothetical protein
VPCRKYQSGINEAAAYYENNLGFTVDWGGEELGLAGISKGNCRMFLSNSDYRKECWNAGPVLVATSQRLRSALTTHVKRAWREVIERGSPRQEELGVDTSAVTEVGARITGDACEDGFQITA